MAKKSQILILSLIAALLSATPLLSASIRSAYHYFIVNLLIVALGVEAGLLSSSTSLKPAPAAMKTVSVSTSSDHNNPTIPGAAKASTTRHGLKTNSDNGGSAVNNGMRRLASVSVSASPDHYYSRISACLQEDNTISSSTTRHGLETNSHKPSPSPSIFFIGCEENIESEEALHGEEGLGEDEVVGGISGQELFAQAEAFIGKFYEQLKVQRQKSWNRIHNASLLHS